MPTVAGRSRRFVQRALGACALLALVISASCNTTPKATAPAITTTSAMLAAADQTVAYMANVTATGGTGPFTWTITSGPAWLSTAASTTNTVVIQGTPPVGAPGPAPFTIKITDAKGLSNPANLSVTVNAAPMVTTTSAQLAVATQGAAYNANVTATGGTAPFAWQILVAPPPPPWLNAAASNTNMVTIQGTPLANAQLGQVNFSIKVTDAAGGSFTQPLVITVNPPAALMITTTQAQVPNGFIGIGYAGANMVASGGIPPFAWSNPSGSLKNAGLALDPNTGAISGTPTTTNGGAAIIADIQVADSNVPATTTPLSNFNISVGVANPDACGTVLGGNESLLNGEYTFYVQGFDGVGVPYAFAASFNADGTGKLRTPAGGVAGIAGHEDFTTSAGTTSVDIKTTGAPPDLSYTVGPAAAGNRGCITLVDASNNIRTFRFALGGVSGAPAVATKGRIIEFDDAIGNANRASGILRQQTTTDFSAGHLQANYAFGMEGFTTLGHYDLGGSFSIPNNTVNPVLISSLFSDFDDSGNASTSPAATGDSGGSGSLTLPISTTTGRVQGMITDNAGHTYNLAIYIVNAAEFFAITTDTLSTTQPILSGRMILTAAAFSNSTAAGTVMIHVNGTSGGSPNGTIGVLTFTPAGATVTGTIYNVNGGVAQAPQPIAGTYAVVAASGRTTLMGAGNNPPAIYLATGTDGISAFIIGLDNSAFFGTAEAQNPPAGPYSAGSVTGTYTFGIDHMIDNTVTNVSGSETIGSGVISSDIVDFSNTGGLTIDFSVPPDPPATPSFTIAADGSGTWSGLGSLTNTTYVVTNGTTVFILDDTSGVAEIIVLEK